MFSSDNDNDYFSIILLFQDCFLNLLTKSRLLVVSLKKGSSGTPTKNVLTFGKIALLILVLFSIGFCIGVDMVSLSSIA
jgi:hypothetical protein